MSSAIKWPAAEDRRICRASAAGAKEPTSTRRSAHLLGPPHRRAGLPTERAQEATQASAPPGVPAKSQISWGGHAPGRLGQRRCKGLPPTATEVRRLGEEDWATYRRVRLDALKEAPYAFGSTHAGEAELDETSWRGRLKRRPTFVAEVDGTIAGTVATGDSDASGVAALIAMWVDPRYRRQGVGDVLVKTVIAWATDHGYNSLFLWVTAVNAAAERLYRRNGFVRTGASQDVRPGELEYEMSKRLR